MRDVLEKWDKGNSIGGRKVTNLRYSDDTTLIAGTKYDLTELIKMTTGKLDHIIVDDKNIEIVDRFIFL